ncbi:hypothetical protein LguiA_028153 [Lonicera macranthoides]
MEGNSSYGTSWADQWDNGPDPAPAHVQTGPRAKYGKKVGDGFGKTKAVASNGMKKVKSGTSVGIQWIKSKYQKTTQKH